MKKILLLFLFTIICFSGVYATHNRAGQIIYRHISGYTYEVEIWTYTYSKSQADRDSLTLSWGDGSYTTLPRVMKNELPNFYYENKYIGRHTYAGPGTFVLVTEDPNRNEGVQNIPNSVNTIFALTTILQINPFIGYNSAAILYTRPIDKAAVGQLFIHNPGAFDPDGDSLSFKMDTCRYDRGMKIPGFFLPPASTNIYVDPVSGDFVWNAPTQVGIYNVAMRIEEWRNGIKISSIVRDIQIEVEETDNRPPEIAPLNDICVIAGDSIQFLVGATDPDNDGVFLEATGAPFEFPIQDSPATFPDSIYGMGTVVGQFKWNTNCSHIAKGPYIVTFKATDDNPQVHLTDYKTVNIKVLGPPVELTEVSASNTNVLIKWNASTCSTIKGYKIYRRNDSENFSIPDCQPGMPDTWGYELIQTINNPSTNVYVDQHVTPGFIYCYRIVPFYTENLIDGIVSDKLCVEIAEGLPILTKSSVLQTAIDTGSVRIEWIPPLNFDTLAYSGPYRYLLYASRDLFGTSYLAPWTFNSIEDTFYVDLNIDTKNDPSCYKLELQHYDSSSSSYVTIGDPSIASTPWLNIRSANRRNDLTIEENVPWDNEKYVIYRYNNNTSQFDSIGQSFTNFYRDTGLVNMVEYCYKVKSISHYTADSMPDPIVNFSQIKCGIPIDTIAPCCPQFTVESKCDLFKNVIKWNMPADSCKDGLANYLIYYKNRLDDSMQLLVTLSPNDTMYEHFPEITLAACYIVSAIDSAGNISECSNNIQCVDICSYYELPNIFTPNSDNINDLYHPLPYKFVQSIDLKIYNRWGNLVFETTDPDINWNGNDISTGKLVSDGVYYYICDVFEERLSGVVPRNISGFIHIYRNSKNSKP